MNLKKKIIFVLIATFLLNKGFAQKNTFSFSKESTQARCRVIIDNDFGGDPDGLFQLAHQVLSTGASVEAVIGSFVKPFLDKPPTAEFSAEQANSILNLIPNNKIKAIKGANGPLKDLKTPENSDGAQFIIKEALREDTKLPLYIVCGASLSTLASAYLIEPKIAEKITLIWIGGPEYDDLAYPPPNYTTLEYNTGLDIKSVQVIFNESNIPIYQVPRNAYRQVLISYAELLTKVKNKGNLGNQLFFSLEDLMKKALKANYPLGETYILGDSPLVLLTALQSPFEADPSSSTYVLKNSPLIDDQGLYQFNPKGRNIRVYKQLDVRLLLEDFFAKLSLFQN